MEPIWTLGTMSGTSMDGIDLAMVLTDGEDNISYGPKLTCPYDETVTQAVRAVLGQFDSSVYMSRAEQLVTQAHISAIKDFVASLDPEMRPELIGFHGQTVAHQPPTNDAAGRTLQLGDGQAIADACGIAIAYDFRTADMVAGGQGAPLVPIFQKAATQHLQRPTAIINIGGVANITYVSEDHLIAFDTGPGCALIDDWVRINNAGGFDVDGNLAMQGKIDKQLVTKWLKHPYFTKAPPKSLDRDTFTNCLQDCKNLNIKDGAATLAAFTAKMIALGLEQVPLMPYQIFICGGGRNNLYILQLLRELFKSVSSVEAIGLDGDAMEAQAFAYLAVRSARGIPITFPETTGCNYPTLGGQMARPNVKIVTDYKQSNLGTEWLNV